jgi:hypothetical protein
MALWGGVVAIIYMAAIVILALIVVALALMRSKRHSRVVSCPTCGSAARLHERYWMCDDCKRMVGVAIDGRPFISL